jgi:hypothetical protein
LVARFGAATVVAAGLVVFAAGVIVWAVLAGSHPDLGITVLCVIPSGIGVGLTLPTLMGVGTSALPASSFATGSGVINMVRQIGFAIGVAIFVAIARVVGGRRVALARHEDRFGHRAGSLHGSRHVVVVGRTMMAGVFLHRCSSGSRPSAVIPAITHQARRAKANLFAFDRPFIVTPDLPKRLKNRCAAGNVQQG